MTKIEKELKVKIIDFKDLIQRLLNNKAIILNKSKEKTIRFDTPEKSLEKNGIFLRVRSGSKNTITLKEKVGDDKITRTRKETEFEIEDIDKMSYILEKLGFTYIRIMEKVRINIKYKEAMLSIDELPFGFYLEIEGTDKQINEIAAELGYKTEDKILGTYWDLFEEYKKENNVSEKDIVFSDGHVSKLLEEL